jgi:hypothetical protein
MGIQRQNIANSTNFKQFFKYSNIERILSAHEGIRRSAMVQ